MLLRDETHHFPGRWNTRRPCRVRLYLPAEGSGHDKDVVILTGGGQADGTRTSSAVEDLAAPLCARFNLPPERTVFIEHHDRRHLPDDHDGLGCTEGFLRAVFAVPNDRPSSFSQSRGATLGKPGCRHTDRQSVEQLIDCHLS